MLSAFANSLKIPELRKRILFTLGLILISRIVTTVPTPGIDSAALQEAINDIKSQQGGGGFIGFIDLFSGGAFGQCAVGALSIWPYISASIILQLMTAIVPALERLAREGDTGRQKLTQYTRYLTLVICVIQGLFLAISLENPAALGISREIVLNPGLNFKIMTILTMTTGTMILMWLGEQITERGIGNGISIIITVNIVSSFPQAILQTVQLFSPLAGDSRYTIFHLVGLLVLAFIVTAGTIALTQGQRNIPIHTAKRVVGRKVYGGQNTYFPMRVNYSGVMPIIFAAPMIMFPTMLLGRVQWEWCQQLNAALQPGAPMYLLVYGALILFFSYFWVATQFNPLQIADDLKRNSGYVPGIRPGRPTAEFLDKTMTRITLIGAVFLTAIAVIPTILTAQFGVPWLVSSFLGGTSLLIIVGVLLDTLRQAQSHLLMRHYDGFLKKGRLGGRR
jgi:preprotein translocase subunit SecY